MENKMTKVLYKVRTSYDGDPNFDSYNVLAENGMSAGAIVNLKIFKKRAKVQHESVDEIERIGKVDLELDYQDEEPRSI